MKICLLGNCSGNIDEGMKNIIFNISRRISKNHEVIVLNPLDFLSPNFWRSLKQLNPDIVHYIPGPSMKSFFLMKLISFYCGRKTKIIMSAVLPDLSLIAKEFMCLVKPDLMIVQSKSVQHMFVTRGFKTELLPLSGINIEKFYPINSISKYRLREKYYINLNSYIILHVGHIKPGRNIYVLKRIQDECSNVQIIIVGSTTTQLDVNLLNDLIASGCIVYTNYIENIEDLYQLSDCYLFPTIDKLNSILLPLSVLEAMACNLPVISMRFGCLPEYFMEGNGLIFVESDDQMIIQAKRLREEKADVSTREKVQKLSWEIIAKDLERIYYKLYSERNDD